MRADKDRQINECRLSQSERGQRAAFAERKATKGFVCAAQGDTRFGTDNLGFSAFRPEKSDYRALLLFQTIEWGKRGSAGSTSARAGGEFGRSQGTAPKMEYETA